MGVTFSQFFPPKAGLTEQNLPRQDGKVFFITGATSGLGNELALMLYQRGGKVYVGGRSEESVSAAIERIKAQKPETSNPGSPGSLEPFVADLSDLTTIKPAVKAFLEKEKRLDVLWNNAGVSQPPAGSKSKQGYELHLAINCLASMLLTQLLLPLLQETAAMVQTPANSVRVVWTSSQVVELSVAKGGFKMDAMRNPGSDGMVCYANSKLGNYYLAYEVAQRVKASGVISINQNPGNLKTNLLRHATWLMYVSYPLLYRQRLGAYTELWSGVSADITMDDTGGYMIPWGRKHPALREDLAKAAQEGRAKEFYEWCEEQVAAYR